MFSTSVSANDHAVKSVTVFKSNAEVVRTFTLDLKAGQNKVKITDLPTVIDSQSIRVSGLGNARLFDVVCTTEKTSEGKLDDVSTDAVNDVNSLSETIRQLKVKKLALQSEKRVREHEADLLVNYAKTLTGEHIGPSNMTEFLTSFVEQGRTNLAAVTDLSERILEIDRQIKEITTNAAEKKGSAKCSVTVVIGAKEDSSIELKLTYIVHNASWVPSYELHATTENGKPTPLISLHYRARVTQSTGEDWTDTSLTLSTVALDPVNRNIPDLLPLKLRPQPFKSAFLKNVAQNTSTNIFSKPAAPFGPQQQTSPFRPPQQQTSVFSQAAPMSTSLFGQAQAQQQPSVGLFGASQHSTGFGGFGGFGGSSLFGSSMAPAEAGAASSAPVPAPADPPEEVDDISTFEEVDAPGTLSEPNTIVSETPLAMSYSVEEKSTIPTDGQAHQVSIAILPFDAKISHVVIPRVEPRVYLQCEVKNTSEYRLLPGRVSVIMDDSYVSSIWIHDINTGDTFVCTLGTDPAVKVSYSRTSTVANNETGAFAEAMKTVTYTTKVVVQNKRQHAIPDLLVREGLPIVEDKRAKVILRKPNGLAGAKDGEKVNLEDGLQVMWTKPEGDKGGVKNGVFEWRWKVGSASKVTLEAVWEVKAPADFRWVLNN